MRSSIIIIAPDAFHLGWMGSTKRLFQIAYAFQNLGLNPVLISAKIINPETQNFIDKKFPGTVIRTPHTGSYPSILDKSKFTRRIWRANWKIYGEKHYWRKLHLGWAEKININHLRKEFKKKSINPLLIWGVSAGYLDGAAGAELLSKKFNTPWVFELHDPPRNAGLGKEIEDIKDKFKNLLSNASKIIVTAESYGSYLEKNYNLPTKKSIAIHLTYDGQASETSHHHDKKYNILYAGSLNGERSLRDLIKAIHLAKKIEPNIFEDFLINLAGTGPGFDEVKQISSDLKIENHINYLGVLPPNKIEVLINSCNAIVVVQEKNSYMQVPGKVFEAIKNCKPVIGIMPVDCEAATILKNSGLGFIEASGDIEKIASTLIFLKKSFDSKRSAITPDFKYINQFSTENLASKIKLNINEILR